MQRRFPRYSVDRPVTAVVFWDETPVAKVHGRTVVLGEGGMSATMTNELYAGDIVQLCVPPAPWLYAKVCHVHGDQHGFEFLYTSGSQRDAIKNLLGFEASRI